MIQTQGCDEKVSKKKIPFSGQLIKDIAETYGTPFHLYDEKGILDNVKRLQQAFSWHPDFYEYFADRKHGFAIQIKNKKRYTVPKNLKEDFNLTPPQSFAYIK